MALVAGNDGGRILIDEAGGIIAALVRTICRREGGPVCFVLKAERLQFETQGLGDDVVCTALDNGDLMMQLAPRE